MPPGFFYDYVPQLMIALFGASLFLGLAIGYCRWGAVKRRLQLLIQENSQQRQHINQVADEIETLKAQLKLVE